MDRQQQYQVAGPDRGFLPQGVGGEQHDRLCHDRSRLAERACTPAAGGPITTQNIKSCLALPWRARLEPGRQRLRGVAFSPFGRIQEVHWQADDGGEWRPAQLASPALPNAWAWFEFAWEAAPGPHILRVRATDEAGNIQPPAGRFNAKGYLFNGVLPHPVQVG